AGLHVWKDRVKTFLRFRTFPDTGRITGLTAVLFIVVQPVIWYLGYLNSQLPVPDYFSELQQSQYEMIESFLRSDGALLMAMVNIAFVPAICEEVMFRGYVLSAFEKNWGIWPAIIVSGLMFGLFHLQLTNLLPLASLGFLLALVTWISGSLVPAIVAHFVNNGSAVLLSTYFPDMAVTELTAETAPPVWTLIASILLTAWLIRQLFVSSESESEQR
ncbi:MAG: CPBP family intramembrane glutamic endopeptidase, partial [Balneolaceae bacterium]